MTYSTGLRCSISDHIYFTIVFRGLCYIMEPVLANRIFFIFIPIALKFGVLLIYLRENVFCSCI